LVEEFRHLREPVLPETLEVWLGHPLTQGLDGEEMQLMRDWLEDLRGFNVVARRADGTPRKRATIPPPPRPNPKKRRGRKP
jgi:hypothetical protein